MDGTLECALDDVPGELKSDCDEQLIIRTAFQQPIKLHSIRLDAGGDMEQAPKTVRIFANVTNPLDFDDAENQPSTQDLELEPDAFGKPIPLRFVKFQNVQNLTIFIKVRVDRTPFQLTAILAQAGIHCPNLEN